MRKVMQALSFEPARFHAGARRRIHQGQAAVEIALLLPILILLLFGIIMSGFTFYAYIQVSNAAREGARAGSVYRITQAASGLSLDQTVKNAIYYHDSSTTQSALGLLPVNSATFQVNSDVSIELHDAASDVIKGSSAIVMQRDRLYVNVTYRYTIPIVSSMLRMFPQPIVIQRAVMMEVQ